MQPIYLNLFDSYACVTTNDSVLHQLISTLYQRLLVCKPDAAFATYELVQSGDKALFTTPTSCYELSHWPEDRDDVAGLILYEMMVGVQSHLLFHGAALEVEQRGVAIVADSRQGKTTLAMALLQKGANFMSDEVAAISLDSAVLNGMPRALSIRAETPGLLNMSLPESTQGPDSVFCDVDAMFDVQVALQAPLRKVFILSNHLQDEPADRLFLKLHCDSAEWQAAVLALPTVQSLKARSSGGSTDVFVRTSDRHATMPEIEAISTRLNVLILSARTHINKSPDFNRQPEATRLSTAEAAIDMLSHLQGQGNQQSRLMQERFAGDERKLFGSLIHSLKHADCYRLKVGLLPETVDLVQTLIRA